MKPSDLHRLIDEHLLSPESSWNIGAFGAIAEFHRNSCEGVSIDGPVALTARGAIAVRLPDPCRAYAYELPGAREESWLHGVALCMPERDSRMSRRLRVTELGPDREAIRPQDRSAILFDLGLGLANCDFCVRTNDPKVQGALREAPDTPLLENEALFEQLTRLSPHRVMLSRLGRIEVFQRIASHGERSPDGPHTHLLPKLVRQRRTHVATMPIPEGWVPCLSLYPPNPVLDGNGRPKAFDPAEYRAFQALLEHFGDREFLLAKHDVMAALRRREMPDGDALANRKQRTAYRVALRQLRSLGATPGPDALA